MKANPGLPKKLLLVSGMAAGLIGLSGTNAFAAGDVYGSTCIAVVTQAPGQGSNWAVGAATNRNPHHCTGQVRLEQWNVNTGDTTYTAWSSSLTVPMYHNDGVHRLRVQLHEAGGTDTWGAWVY
ncbi:hypothetical protein ACIQ9P_38645 [Kitasatospora sp. NPDC094019]|uniref:hypothetical protein n=1 Tax=Kitasatospora sp. NPDC094019 TaxID=3364091 RepID=UPI003829414B